MTSPWLTSAEACDHLRFTGKHRLRSLYRFLKERGIPTARVGTRLRVTRMDLDRAMGAKHRESVLRRDVA